MVGARKKFVSFVRDIIDKSWNNNFPNDTMFPNRSPLLALVSSRITTEELYRGFKLYLRPGYFLLRSSDCTMEACVLLAGVRDH